MLTIGKDGWLVGEAGDPPVEKIPSKQCYPLLGPVQAVVWHWAASGKGGLATVRALAKEIADDKPEPRSWHVMIARTGELVQSVPFTMGSWHVGKTFDLDGAGPALAMNVNRDSIGIEMDCAGRLHKVGEKLLAWPWTAGSADLTSRGVLVTKCIPWLDGYFDTYTPEQIASAEKLVRALAAAYGFKRRVFEWGHVNFDYPRKEDPGPIWMNDVLPPMLDRVFPKAEAIAAAPAVKPVSS